jgi:hypothetical protein
MDNKIKVRFPQELWWDELAFEQVLSWNFFEVSYIDDETCFVKVDGIVVELHRPDYDKIMNNKIFANKFKLNKHTF